MIKNLLCKGSGLQVKTVLFLGSVFCYLFGSSQNISNKGKEFWVGYGHHQFMEQGTNTQVMVLYLSAEEQAATVTITIDSSGLPNIPSTWWRRTYNIPAFSVISIEDPATPAASYTTSAGAFGQIPKGTAGQYDARLYTDPPPAGTGGAGLFRKKGIHIESNVPIVAYAHIYGSASSGATMLLPVTAWGYSYVSINNKQSYAQDCYNWTYVIASMDNTVIEITPSVVTRSQNLTGLAPGVSKTVTLMKGQIYQIIGANDAADGNGNGGSAATGKELTGTKIRSLAGPTGDCYPIAVFAGSSRTANPASCGSGGGDNDNQQQFPQHAWGKKYLTTPFSGSSTPSSFARSTYKIAVKDPATIVKRNGVQLSGIINNNYYTFESSTADYIEADKPIMVVQSMTGGACLGAGGLGDPEMVVLSPIEQAIKRTGFFRNNKENITVNYLTLVVPTPGLGSLLIGGSGIFDYTYAHPGLTGYTVVVKRWATGAGTPLGQCIVTCDSAFTGITYGEGSVESYGYNIGAYLNNLNAAGDIHNVPDTSNGGGNSHAFTCINTPIKLSVLMRYQPLKLLWQINTLGSVVAPNADVLMDPASNYFVDSIVVGGIKYYRYTLPGTYTFNTAGLHNIPIKSTALTVDNCNNTEDVSITVDVRPSPVIDFNISHTGCSKDTVYFSGPTSASNGYNINQWVWTLPGGITGHSKDTGLVFPQGTYTAQLYVASTEGCAATITKTFSTQLPPVTTFQISPPSGCVGQTITLNDNSTYSGPTPITNWYWDLGDGNIVNATNNNPIVHTYASANTYTIKHAVRASGLCVSDTVVKIVPLFAGPVTSFTYPAGCLPPSNVAQFTAAPTSIDGQTITSYLWTFGDANANAGNPNTSTSQNPTHIYSTFGTYTITLHVTSSQGCSKDTSVTVTLNVRAALAYSPLPSVCENVTGTISVANGSVTNGAPGTGVYHGPATDLAGNFNPSAAGWGTKTIWYVFTTTAGCIDSVSQTILVRAKPLTDFTFPAGGCLPANGLVQFTNTTTVADGQTLTYLWNFNDPNANAGNPNTSTATNPSHNFSEGTYTILLSATTSGGCTAPKSTTVTFSVKPQLSWASLPAICENISGTISIASALVTNGVTGTGLYKGPGTDAAGNFSPSVAGWGTKTIWYVFTSTGGCKDSVSQTILVNAKPRIGFTTAAGGCLPSNGLVQFTNTTTIPDGQTLTYAWLFNDANANAGNPNTSTSQNPTHNFQEGTYSIYLKVTTANGCWSDTTISFTFSVKPLLAYSALSPVCENAGTFSVANGSVTNGITGTGVYSGPGTDAAGNFNPSVAGYGTKTIWYVFTTTGGCKDSVSQTILVRAKPKVNFTFPTGACLATNGQVQFTNGTTIGDGQTMTWAWDFNDLNANGGNPNTSTLQNPTHNFGELTYNIKLVATTPNGCVGDTTITATFSVKPALTYPVLPAICENTGSVSVATATVTNGVTGTGVYSGPGTNAAGNFTPSAAGFGTKTIWYVFTSTGGCKDSVSQTILVRAKPKVNFTYPAGGCLAANGFVQFTNATTIGDGQTMTWAWNFNDANSTTGNPNTSILQNPSHNFLEGTYNIKLQATTSNGCFSDTAIFATFSLKPSLSYSALSPVCESAGTVSVANGSVTNGVTGTGVYSGPGTDVAGNLNPSIAGAGTKTIWYVFTSAGGCKDSVSQTVLIRAKPKSDFAYPSAAGGCLPPNGFVQFLNRATISDGQTMTYLWDFGDVLNSNAGNPNTSTLQNPSHNFLEGTYTIKLRSTTSNGCFHDTAITATFSVKPALTYAPLTSVCASSATSLSVATASVTNGVNGTGVYSGPGTNAAGNFNPSAAGTGTHTIWYVFTSTGGCKDSVSQTIKVHPKPTADFTVSNTGVCLGQSITITDASTITTGTIKLRDWDLGDGSVASYPNGNPFNKIYTTFGNYTIKLVATSDSGCVSDPFTKNVSVHALPVPDFGIPASVCMPGGNVAFNNLTAIADNAALSYVWDFGDASPTAITTNASHVYAATGSYNIKLTATSSFGCTKDTIKAFSAFFDKPVANFSVSADTLCQGVGSSFTDLSTAPNSTIQTWSWNFGDATISNQKSPTKKYTLPGNYPVTLVVKNVQGCTSDTFTKPVIVYLQPVIDAGPSFVVPLGASLQFKPVANDTTLQFLWSPPIGLNNPAVLKPTLVAMTDQTYTLTATGQGKCQATDIITVKILKPIKVPNAFSPNGDATNDTWIISYLEDYPGSTVEVFNRYGQQVFISYGYSKPWDGTYNGKPLPVATYYYIITLKNGFAPVTGSVTIIR